MGEGWIKIESNKISRRLTFAGVAGLNKGLMNFRGILKMFGKLLTLF
jgi:hypothetical protein